MAVEERRGCGFRQVGKLYLVGPGLAIDCDRLPWPLDKPCPTCGTGIHLTRGIQWLDGKAFFGGNCAGLNLDQEDFEKLGAEMKWRSVCHKDGCDICLSDSLGKVALMWVGKRFYPTPEDFVREAISLGVSKAIRAVPKELKLGETYVLLAHLEGIIQESIPETPEDVAEKIWTPAIFYVFRPQRIEKIITGKTPKEELARLEQRGITPVVVPCDDPDHNPEVRRRQKAQPRRKILGVSIPILTRKEAR
jgi:hypothetical protein